MMSRTSWRKLVIACPFSKYHPYPKFIHILAANYSPIRLSHTLNAPLTYPFRKLPYISTLLEVQATLNLSLKAIEANLAG